MLPAFFFGVFLALDDGMQGKESMRGRYVLGQVRDVMRMAVRTLAG
jgi:hypothetical protein